jgi:hypothetical protein
VYDDQISDKFDKEVQILDFDTKHLDMVPKKPSNEARWRAAISANGTRDVMAEERYGAFFNKWVRTFVKYGGALSKDTKDGPQVVSWHNVVTDQSDIMSGVIIERHYYTPSDLMKMEGKWKNIKDAIALAEDSKERDKDKDDKTQGHYIEIHEVRGELPESLLEEDGDPHKYRRVIRILAGVNQGQEDEDGVELYAADETKNPYKYLARNPIDGVALGVGIYEELLPQQVIHNLVINDELRMIGIAGRVYAKTNNANIPDSLTDFDHLSVIKLNTEAGEFFELTSAIPSGLPGFRDMRAHIAGSMQSRSGMHEAVTGEEGKANKPLGLHKMQNIEGHTRFRPRRQDIGFHFEEMVREWTLPKALKQIRQANELYTTFTDTQLLELDEVMRNKEMQGKLVEKVLSGELITEETMMKLQEDMQRKLSRQGKKRFITDLQAFLKDVDDDIRISFTDESFSKSDFYDNRISFIQLYGPEHPWSQAMARGILDEAGITPDQIALEEQRSAQMAGTPRGMEIAGNEDEAPAQQV